LDALAHAVEGYVSRAATALTRLTAETAVRALLTRLEAATEAADLEARTELMVGACFAGAVQNLATPGVGHAIAHQLAASDTPHALATGGLLAGAIRANAAADPQVAGRFDALAKAVGLHDARALATEVARLATKFGVSGEVRARLKGVEPRAAFMEGVLLDPCARANPVQVDEQLVLRVLEDAA
jgi:alcohol dehydrogenase class IV